MESQENAAKPDQWNMMNLYPKSHWGKMMFKLPILSWRLGLGPITGKLFLLLTTTGRKTGVPRRTMMEYVKVGGRKYAPCAFGERANWYQNLIADPYVTIQTSDGTERMRAVRVTDAAELLSVIDAEMRFDPPMVRWYLNSMDINPDDPDDILAHKDQIYFIRFDPVEKITPPGLEVDLAWVWPLALLLAFFMRRRRNCCK